MKIEEHRDIASDIGEESGEFFFVKAEAIPLKFSAQRAGPGSDMSKNTNSPSVGSSGTGSHGHGFWKPKPFHRSHGSKPDKDYV